MAASGNISTTKKKKWKNWIDYSEKNHREIGDIIHGQILIFYPIDCLIDTPPFQRLRRLNQLSFAKYVFPGCTHDRFSHSIGVYHLARLRMERFAKLDSNVTPNDALCVCIAALIHDLGHGPYCHFYDLHYLKGMQEKNFTHEKMSCNIFDYMCLMNGSMLKEVLDVYLEEQDYIFIKELVNPPKPLIKEGKWLPRGRPPSKGFLFEIVSDPYAGFDVDKIDYILRDSYITNVGKKFQKNDFERIQNHTHICVTETDGIKHTRIAYSDKIRDLLENIFEDRIVLHKNCYQHKTTVAVGLIMFQVLRAATESVKFKGSDGVHYKMTDAFNNIEAFLKMDDEKIRAMIGQLADVEEAEGSILEANSLLQKLEYRQLPKLVDRLPLKPTEDVNSICEKIHTDLVIIKPELRSNIFVHLVTLDRGQGPTCSPTKEIMYFENKNPKYIIFNHELHSQKSGGSLYAYIYLSYETRESLMDAAKNAVESLYLIKAAYLDGMYQGRRKRKSSVLREINSDEEEGTKQNNIRADD